MPSERQGHDGSFDIHLALDRIGVGAQPMTLLPDIFISADRRDSFSTGKPVRSRSTLPFTFTATKYSVGDRLKAWAPHDVGEVQEEEEEVGPPSAGVAPPDGPGDPPSTTNGVLGHQT